MLSKLDELRTILLGPDHDKLEEVSSRIEQPEQRAADVAEVLPESVARSFRRDSRLTGALRDPLRQCVSESVREDPEQYADALFPIMGPAIRRAVAEALKGWIQQANQAIEQSLSPRGLEWRFQAWRAGIPYGQYVLQQTLLYRVEHVYLIHSASGLLMAHVQQPDAVAKDEDAVSAMFTAIQEFVRDSFSGAERLRTAELGELALWAVHGPSCILVAVIQGSPPAALRGELQSVLERLETGHSEALRDYRGDPATLPELGPELTRCLVSSSREPAPRRSGPSRGPSPVLVAAALAGLALVAWLAYGAWLDMRAARVASTLEMTPGIVVTHLERQGDELHLRGLRDPTAPTAETLAAEAGWTGALDASFEPYFSLDAGVVIARAREALAPPESVALALRGDTLVLSGQAPYEWMESTRGASLAGVGSIDLSALAVDGNALLDRLRELLDPPPGVALAYEDGRLVVSGEAPAAFRPRLAAAVNDLPGIDALDVTRLAISEELELRALAESAGRVVVRFDPGQSTVQAESLARLEALVPALREYAELARTLGFEPRVLVTGHSTPTGSDELNRRLEQDRAAAVASALVAGGADPGWLVTRSQLEGGATGTRAAVASIRLATGGHAAEH